MALHGSIHLSTHSFCLMRKWDCLAVCRAESVVVLHVVLVVIRDLEIVYSGTSSFLCLQRQPKANKDIADVRGSLRVDARLPGSFCPTLGTCELLRSPTVPPPASSVK